MAFSTASAAGLRPYLTILIIALAKAFVPETAPEFVTAAVDRIPALFANEWLIGTAALLTVLEFLGDKVWGYSAAIETVNQFLRPILAAGIGASFGMEHGTGIAAATTTLSAASSVSVSLGKTALTFATNALPESITQVIRSLLEDGNALVLALLALFAPIIAAILTVIVAIAGLLLFITLRRLVRKMRAKFASFRENRAAIEANRAVQQQSNDRPRFSDLFAMAKHSA